MAFSYDRAMALIDEPRSNYKCNQVVNMVLNGNRDIGGLAEDYFNRTGIVLTTPCAGAVIAGKSLFIGNPWHCGIFVNNNEFIHSSLSKGKVIKVPLSQIKYIFLKGEYVIKKLA